MNLKLNKESSELSECHLTFCVTHQLYQRIDTEALFNLKPEIRAPLSGGNFQPSSEIQIQATLDPALLPKLAENSTNANQAASYLQQLSQKNPKHPILSTYSWYALEVKQKQETGETGYRTLWAYLKPSDITSDGIDSEKMSEAMLNFAKEWADSNNSEDSVDVMSQAIEEMNHTFEELTNNISEMTEEIVSESIKEMTDAFEEITNSISEISEEIADEENVFKAVVNFFIEDDWQFAKLETQPTLRLAFQGKNGKWDCYAKAREQQQQFVFYSVSPINAPENKRLPITEFITRANYGMIMGNFEFDFTTGEIRYKTSIDVEGDNLSFALIKQMVYANVMMMDEYLPGIMAVIEGEVEVKEAILLVEG
ncbi:YbjN domain-containing protein [Calothrix rhizosoleniae]|uniref:YbjN domain-containing protein n=1 Tax=Calothrix rhizosoleniae TaxID=888997 RepID=UPI001F15FCA4|nr:YbjN domain-containing protein [Calothrix rhizosoleniae]